MNWGNGLVIVFGAFALLICTLVYKSSHTHFDLVSKDYYGDELRYQDKIDANANALKKSSVEVVQTKDSLVIVLPAEAAAGDLSGEAWFYCSSDASKDRKIALLPSAGSRQAIAANKLAKASYTLKLSWHSNNESFYNEKPVRIF